MNNLSIEKVKNGWLVTDKPGEVVANTDILVFNTAEDLAAFIHEWALGAAEADK